MIFSAASIKCLNFKTVNNSYALACHVSDMTNKGEEEGEGRKRGERERRDGHEPQN